MMQAINIQLLIRVELLFGIRYILQKENKLIPPLSDESHQLLNYFHIPDKKNDQTKNSNKTVSFSNNIQTMLNK